LGALAFGAGALLAVVLPVGAHVFLVNDICDRRRDRINPERLGGPLATGALTVRAAWFWALVLAVVGLVAAGSPYGELGWAGLVVAGAILLNWDAYAWCGVAGSVVSPPGDGDAPADRRAALLRRTANQPKSKRSKTPRAGPAGWGKCHPAVGAAHNLVGGGLHFLLGVSAAGSPYGEWSSGEALWTTYFGLLCLAGYFHHVARHEEADRASGVTTLATLWGRRAALLLGATVVVVSTVLLTVALVAQGRAEGLVLPLVWLWLSLPLYLFGLWKVLAQKVGWVEQRRFQRFYRSLYVVFGVLLAPFIWGLMA